MSRGHRSAFAIVKEVLLQISKHQTPVSPEHFALWYEYVCGDNDAFKSEVNQATSGGRKVGSTQLLELWDYHCAERDTTLDSISDSLSKEVDQFSSIIEEQHSVSRLFAGSLSHASQRLSQSRDVDASIGDCVSDLEEASKCMQSRLGSTNQRLSRVQELIKTLQADLAESRKESLIDPLTGIGNRRMFDTLVRKYSASSSSSERRWLVLTDLDKFRLINDMFGHDVGDEVIKVFAKLFESSIPEADHARLGGDKFSFFISDIERDALSEKVDALIDTVVSKALSSGNQYLGTFTISVGATFLRPDEDGKEWVRRTSRFLHQSKNLGGNRSTIENSRQTTIAL